MSLPNTYDFKSGWHKANGRRPDRCDICKRLDHNTKPAQNRQGIRCFMCDDCRDRWNRYCKYHYMRDLSRLDAYQGTVITAHHVHDDEPEEVYYPKPTSKPTPRGDRLRIKYLEYQRELQRLGKTNSSV